MASVWKPAKACHDFNNDFTLFTAVPVLFIKDPRDAIHQLEQKLNQLTLTLHPPSEPIEEVLDKYTDTLCTTQKKTSLESSLLQDIPTLNGQDS